MKMYLCRIFLLLALLGVALPSVGWSQEAALKQRIDQRLPAVDNLKAHQIAGENNAGYLEVRGAASAADKQLVSDENRDREMVYELIARQSNTTKDAVGRARAAAIATRSARGVLIQGADGSWAEKK